MSLVCHSMHVRRACMQLHRSSPLVHHYPNSLPRLLGGWRLSHHTACCVTQHIHIPGIVKQRPFMHPRVRTPTSPSNICSCLSRAACTHSTSCDAVRSWMWRTTMWPGGRPMTSPSTSLAWTGPSPSAVTPSYSTLAPRASCCTLKHASL